MIPHYNMTPQTKAVTHDGTAHGWEDIVASNGFVFGKYVKDFETYWADWAGTSFCVTVNSGTDALVLALKALDMHSGSGVVVPANTFWASAEAVINAGLVPVLCDVDPHTLTMDPVSLDNVIRNHTGFFGIKAIMPVHLYGQPADMDPIMEIAREHGLWVVEDCAQAHGAVYKRKPVGGIGHIAAWSFYPTKNLGAFGDGGAVTTNHTRWAERVRSMRHHGREDQLDGMHGSEQHVMVGTTSRLNPFQAVILSAKLEFLKSWNDDRVRQAFYYNEQFADEAMITPPSPSREYQPVFHLYVVRVQERERFMRRLSEVGIETRIHYRYALHQLNVPGVFLGEEGQFPVVEAAVNQIVSLPLWPGMPAADSVEVVRQVKEVLHD